MTQDDLSKLSLGRLRVIIVDDDPQTISMLSLALRSMGVREIQTFERAAAAIDYLKSSSSDALGSGVTNTDIIISDYVMPEVDGSMLLRWVRLNEMSPDPFVCFIIVSGAADTKIIQGARLLGMTEFFAKPFSIEAVQEKVRYAIEEPRDFFLAPGYFGPDRRREALVDDYAKRGEIPQVIEVIRPDRGPDPLPDGTTVLHFQHPNRLLGRVQDSSSATRAFVPRELAPEIRRRIACVHGTFPTWATRQVGHLETCNTRLKEDGNDATKTLRQIAAFASRLEGPSAYFDYPLLGEISKSLKSVSSPRDTSVDNGRLMAIENHIEGLAHVLRERITSTENDAAQGVRKHVFGSEA